MIDEKKRAYCRPDETTKTVGSFIFKDSPDIRGEVKERILRKTVFQIIEREVKRATQGEVFTTTPRLKRKKTGHKTVRKICHALADHWYPETVVSYEAMDRLLITEFQRCDRKTRLAYLGRPKKIQIEKVQHTVRYQKSGTTVQKSHTFTHNLPELKGYLDIFGLASLFTDKKGKAWFRLYHKKQETLIPPESPLQRVMNVSRIDPNIISLPLSRDGEAVEKEHMVGSRRIEKKEIERESLSGRENRSSESIPGPQKQQPELTAEELRILKTVKGEGPG